MAVRETTSSWSGNNNGAYWGLTRKIGPYKETPADVQRLNSQAGGPHAGHGNWWQSFDPHPYIQTKHTPGNSYKYVDSPDVVTKEIYVKPHPGMKTPGRGMSGAGTAPSGMRPIFLGENIGPLKDRQTEDQKRGYGVGIPEEEKVVQAHIETSFPKRVRKVTYPEPSTSMPTTLERKRKASMGGSNLHVGKKRNTASFSQKELTAMEESQKQFTRLYTEFEKRLSYSRNSLDYMRQHHIPAAA